MFRLKQYSEDYSVVVLKTDGGACFVHDKRLGEALQKKDFFISVSDQTARAYLIGEGRTRPFRELSGGSFPELSDAQEWVLLMQALGRLVGVATFDDLTS